jgi:hypothetical protein
MQAEVMAARCPDAFRTGPADGPSRPHRHDRHLRSGADQDQRLPGGAVLDAGKQDANIVGDRSAQDVGDRCHLGRGKPDRLPDHLVGFPAATERIAGVPLAE